MESLFTLDELFHLKELVEAKSKGRLEVVQLFLNRFQDDNPNATIRIGDLVDTLKEMKIALLEEL